MMMINALNDVNSGTLVSIDPATINAIDLQIFKEMKKKKKKCDVRVFVLINLDLLSPFMI